MLNAIVVISLLNLISHIRKVSIVFVILLIILLTIEATLAITFSTQITMGLFASIMETNRNEALGAIRMYSFISIPLLVITSVVIWLAYKGLKPKKAYVLISTILILASLSIGYGTGYVLMDKSQKAKVISDLKISYPMHFQSLLGIRFPLLTNMGFASIAYYQEMSKFRADLGKPKSMPMGVDLLVSSKTPNTLFVVIGESSLQTHYSLYGYDLFTTPFLDSLKNDNLLYYYNAVSPASITRDALSMSLSFATPLDRTPFADNKNIVALANDAGYESYWISNQNKIGMHDSYVGLIASYAKTSVFYNFLKDDLELIGTVKSFYNPKVKQVFFIHLKGSHLEYTDKYDNEDSAALAGNGNETIEYDRSIHHTDRVLKSLYNNIVMEEGSSVSSLIYYFSDHGEIINKGHGFLDNNMDQFLVPFLAIPYNLEIGTDEIIDKYLVDGRLNTTNFNYIFSEAIGYHVSEKAIKKAKNDGLYYYHVDGKTYLFNDIKK
ncbi:sulfatase-like hydrolase/transferase [Dysgonomonas sp. GY617]|uniref:sulfatase-like hydrolase/transferase n=1 Tax=Dysgonomonas sp. GY617 TaxID=2780420 RepID=UPI0018840C88|nr:sulfatase-like hydrolase/transferase [Dysgonomonas sp. GY617]MBF0577932.1 sulfatase-like hydrolase/transferase [Dysgonomonas sp. GY617]